MSVRCEECGTVAGYGFELGHRVGCPRGLVEMKNRADVGHLRLWVKSAESVLDRVRRVHTELMGQVDRARRSENIYKAQSEKTVGVIRAIEDTLDYHASTLCESRECGRCGEDDEPCRDWGSWVGSKALDGIQAESRIEQLEEKYGRLKRIAVEAGIDLPSDT